MKRFFLLLVLSSPAYAESARLCYSDVNICVVREDHQ